MADQHPTVTAAKTITSNTQNTSTLVGRGLSFLQNKSDVEIVDLDSLYRQTWEVYREISLQYYDKSLNEKSIGLLRVKHFHEFKPHAVTLKDLAKKGHVNSCSLLATCYESGLGVVPSKIKANYWNAKCVYWLTKAAEQGDLLSQEGLAEYYRMGSHVVIDYEKAVYWYTKAAEQGSSNASIGLGLMYEGADDCPNIDYEKSLYWYTKAAEQGDSLAQHYVGEVYEYGDGAAQNDKKAIYWYMKAAEQGDNDAQLALGRLYTAGSSVAQDLKEE
jgi:hypothetical protein